MEQLAKEWIEFGDEDYKLFKLVGNNPAVRLSLVYYHAQQAVEKWLKGLLILNGLNPPKIHDLSTLSRALESFYPELREAEWLSRSAILSRYATQARYPGAQTSLEEQPTFSQIEEALEAFRSFAEAKLGHHWQDQ